VEFFFWRLLGGSRVRSSVSFLPDSFLDSVFAFFLSDVVCLLGVEVLLRRVAGVCLVSGCFLLPRADEESDFDDCLTGGGFLVGKKNK